MINILLTGRTSKLGLAFREYIKSQKSNEKYCIDVVSLRDAEWEKMDLSKYDSVLHCAGIYKAPENAYKYYQEINVHLSERLARKAVQEGVKQFIYLSTMDIYNSSANPVIDQNTIPDPQSLYGRSKLEAEKALCKVTECTQTKLAIVRCCPVIGRNAESMMEGYMKAFRFPIFPLMLLNDKRSILHVDTLCGLLQRIIDSDAQGVFFPQNLPPLSVAEILDTLKRATGSKTLLVRIPKLMWIRSAAIRRIYGGSCYAPELSRHFEYEYCTMNSQEAILSLYK